MRDPDLWTRIRDCHPDDVEADLPFSGRLARDNDWPEDFAQRVILEYQRFAYLSRLGKGMVTPSDEVDQAWHLHLTYTRHYWGPFKAALGAALHHMPTKGGADQGALFRDTYAKTLDLYRAEFGEPPADIWPPEEIRFGRAPHFRRVNAQEVWLIRKPSCPDFVKSCMRRLARMPSQAWGTLLVLLSFALGTGIALAHGSPEGDTFLERTRNMIGHWASQHEFEFVFSLIVIGFVVWVVFGKSSGRSSRRRSRRDSSGCSTSGNDSSCGSDSGGSGCGGCGGGD
ncbi:glycine-rich domain-containing protein [Roseibium sp. Sym1]|uniref:glycine-rich domain-containing protein n=1 Tax=Roseibium sp. Sym1 TaxID=3016006 RepID=UPI0022B5914C|nr:hypothetical protein [Roseibium sp. Sym1]